MRVVVWNGLLCQQQRRDAFRRRVACHARVSAAYSIGGASLPTKVGLCILFSTDSSGCVFTDITAPVLCGSSSSGQRHQLQTRTLPDADIQGKRGESMAVDTILLVPPYGYNTSIVSRDN